MFWYSVKTHKPATSGTYIVYQETTGYTRIAHVDHKIDGSYEFICEFEEDYLKGISHFADIPAIPLT